MSVSLNVFQCFLAYCTWCVWCSGSNH